MNKETLHKISYGMYIVCSKKGNKFNGQIANAIVQITAEPATIAISINKKNLTHEFIDASKVFTTSILAKDAPLKLIGQFGFKSGKDADKFVGIKYEMGKTGVPVVLDNVLAWFEAEVINKVDAGTHTIFIAKVIEGKILSEAEPMTYAYYHDIKRGSSPETAPTYIKEEDKRKVSGMPKYVCKVCGYVYDPDKGDPDSGVQPGTAFENIPDDWVCPVCGVGKDQFEKE